MRLHLKHTLLLGAVALLTMALPVAAQTEVGTISIGDSVTGELTNAQFSHSYTLDAEAGQVVTITLTSEDFDTYLSLLNADGDVLASNDDSNGTNSAITAIELPEADGYTIVAESYSSNRGNSGDTGEYTLSVSEQQVNRIEYTQVVNAELTSSSPTIDYLFTGAADDVVVISQTSTDFDSYLILLDSRGNELTRNDDGGGSSNSLIGPYTLPSTGTFTIRAGSYSGSATGNFTLTLNKIDMTAVDFDEELEVSFTPASSEKYFTFSGTAGDVVTISADSNGTFDTNLVLRDLYNSTVASDEDGGAGADPEIYQYTLTTSGTYTIVLTAPNPGNGKVTLLVARTLPPSLDDGVQTLSFTSSTYTRAVSFTAESGETVRLNFHIASGVGSPSITLSQNGTTLVSASASSVNDLSFSFTPSADGLVVVQVSDYSFGNLSYEVSLAHAAE